jgi:hypothetical protein
VAARRCSLCGINYPVLPTYQQVTLCPIHDEEMPYDSTLEPDDDWQEQAREIAETHSLTVEDATLIPDIDEDALFVQEGRTFVFSWDVVERGISHRLPDGALLRVGEKVYEVVGYIDAMRAYWVSTFRMYLTDKDIRDLSNPKSRRRKRQP